LTHMNIKRLCMIHIFQHSKSKMCLPIIYQWYQWNVIK
jgi:hypothetical protein